MLKTVKNKNWWTKNSFNWTLSDAVDKNFVNKPCMTDSLQN